MKLFAAPMQGYTDNAFIEAHHEIYGGVEAYCMPFTRIENGGARRQDAVRLRRAFEIESASSVAIVPQIIFNSPKEFDTLVRAVKDAGFRRVDLNLGCPFPMQTRRGRGAAMIANMEVMAQVADAVNSDADTKYSVKMRLGLEQADEWRKIMPILNTMRLEYLAVHPRTASQMYDGTLHLDEFAGMAMASANPVVYNGDIHSRADIETVAGRCPSISGAMIGRGLLMRPSLAAEIASGRDWPLDERRDKFARFHAALLSIYESTLCGDVQILQKIKPLWDYIDLDLDRKALKAIRKATSLSKYTLAVDAAL